ncbi:MAG: serine/threonine-protein kinase PknK [Myxococcales bacterium]|nr:serine/threonine-protein kinase PknK [Myxococcales bacterium]
MSETSDIVPGTRLGPYRLGKPLGHGASATVYVATDSDGQEVAVKVRRRGKPEMDRRFLREFESMRLLRVPGVVSVHQAGIEEELLWFSMDLVRGQSFELEIRSRGGLQERIDAAISLGSQLCSILASLHDAGFVHRDVKPSNVLVDADGEVHVLDFGIGRYFGGVDTLSVTGEVLGTVPYMAPEHLAGLPSDDKLDLFSTGLMIHEAIAGKRERPNTTVGWIPKICLEQMHPLASLFREVPRGLSHLVERMTAVDPWQRPTAREASAALRRVAKVGGSAEWPEPPFVDPGPWWTAVEGCIGNESHAPVQILDGPAGSGRSRIAERLQRMALLQGTWTFHLRCRVDRVGAPLLDLLERLVALLDDPTLAKVVEGDAPVLRHVWPHLPLPQVQTGRGRASMSQVIEAVVRTVMRTAQLRPVLIVVHDLERVDRMTQRAVRHLAKVAGENVGLLLLHESRWASPASRQLVLALQRTHGAGLITVPRLTVQAADHIASSLCPHDPPTFSRPTAAHVVVEASYKALAAWRGEPFAAPDDDVWPLTVRDVPIPGVVFHECVGSQPQSPWVRVVDDNVGFAGPTARRLALPRLGSLKRTAAALASAWERVIGQRRSQIPSDLAAIWLVAGEAGRSWLPAAQAAIRANRSDLFSVSRQWLLLLDTLEQPTQRDQDLEFELALARARAALYTDSVATHEALTELAERRAKTEEHRSRARLLRAELALRRGDVRSALVKALRAGSPNAGAPLDVQVHSLVVALRSRLALGLVREAQTDLSRAQELVAESADPLDAIRLGEVRSELALRTSDLLWCRALCQENIRISTQLHYVRGVAVSARLLGRVLRLLGRRREAEQRVRSAREAFRASGDIVLDADAALALVQLVAERGDALPARRILDETMRRIRRLAMRPLHPTAARLALQVAILTDSVTDAEIALSEITSSDQMDPETPAILVRYWRCKGDIERALAVEESDPGHAFGSILLGIERSRAALQSGQVALVREEASVAAERAKAMGFHELAILASLVLGAVTSTPDESWARLQREATKSHFTEVFLGALEFDARRLHRTDPEAANARWRTLFARAKELGYGPGVAEASSWLAGTPAEH